MFYNDKARIGRTVDFLDNYLWDIGNRDDASEACDVAIPLAENLIGAFDSVL